MGRVQSALADSDLVGESEPNASRALAVQALRPPPPNVLRCSAGACTGMQGGIRGSHASVVLLSRTSHAVDWRGRAARSCRALDSGAAPDGFRACTASSGAVSRRRRRRSSLLSKPPSLLGIGMRSVPAPSVGSKLPSSHMKSRCSSAVSLPAFHGDSVANMAQQLITARQYDPHELDGLAYPVVRSRMIPWPWPGIIERTTQNSATALVTVEVRPHKDIYCGAWALLDIMPLRVSGAPLLNCSRSDRSSTMVEHHPVTSTPPAT
jgi:hypothetical protein